jgi:nucleoside-diphosphate-sugar epimerase
VYGSRPGVHDESAKLEPCRIAQPYAAGERLVLNAAHEKGIPGIVLRPAGVYGFGGVFGRFWSNPMVAGKRTGIPGDGKQLFSFIHIEDCARAFVRCVENPIPGEVFNVADNEPIPLGFMIRSCAEALKAPMPFKIPAFLF